MKKKLTEGDGDPGFDLPAEKPSGPFKNGFSRWKVKFLYDERLHVFKDIFAKTSSQALNKAIFGPKFTGSQFDKRIAYSLISKNPQEYALTIDRA